MSSTKIIEDIDPQETQEWLDAIQGVKTRDGVGRVNYLLDQLSCSLLQSPYINTIDEQDEEPYPGDLKIEQKIRSLIRWNAAAMVVRANLKNLELGGHIGTFASAATLYDVGFNHFWRARTEEHPGDLIFVQGHASPGIYARSFLEGRLSEKQLDNFRQEAFDDGLSSYPHPWLMPDYWQFPTVSMGLGPLQAIYQARIMRYLQAREIIPETDSRVWCFCGDGEMDEPESLGALSIAVREKLNNLVFIINCNLQRLDGPVRGNGKIIQELESIFSGAGWNVIKVIWGSDWDELLAKDKSGLLKQRMAEVVDGEYQNYAAKDGAYIREHFFGAYPELLELVADYSDEQLYRLSRGGHDPKKVYAAYHAATTCPDKPTVILAKTVKGYGLGAAGEGLNTAHNTKKLTEEQLKHFRDRFQIPIKDSEISSIPFYKPKKDSAEIKYLLQQRATLNGFVPSRNQKSSDKLVVPKLNDFETFLNGTQGRDASTTMVFVRMLAQLCKDKNIGKRVVPIVPDEARTFGMEGMFRQLGIYAPSGQLYTPVDSEQVMFYKESKKGQILEEGINEAGSFCSWLASATSYSIHNKITIPFYIYYSMFGFQRIGDLAWAAGDSRARGFLIGGTAGRTTLNGEGLQHEDGHSHIMAGLIPNCISYDPTFGYEMAVIIQDGLRRMVEEQEDVFYYITAMNENYEHPALLPGSEKGIIKGLYKLQDSSKAQAQLLGSGTILLEAIAAAELLKEDFGIEVNVWSATSFNLLARDGSNAEHWNFMNSNKKPKVPYVTEALENTTGPVIAVTDYIKSYADQIRRFVPKDYYVLGTDGFGRSDSRANLRKFFEVDRYYIVLQTLLALDPKKAMDAMKKYNLDADKETPWGI